MAMAQELVVLRVTEVFLRWSLNLVTLEFAVETTEKHDGNDGRMI